MPTAEDYRAWRAARDKEPANASTADAYRQWRAARGAPEVAAAPAATPVTEPPETSGPGLLKTAGQALLGFARGVPAGLLTAGEDIAERISQAVEPSGPTPEEIAERGLPPSRDAAPHPLISGRKLMSERVRSLIDQIAGTPPPATGAAQRATRPYRAGSAVGQTVGGFAAAPVTIPLTVGTSLLREAREQTGEGPPHAFGQEALEFGEALAPPAAAYRQYRAIKADPGLSETDKAAALEDFWATQGPALAGATVGIGSSLGRGLLRGKKPAEAAPEAAPAAPEGLKAEAPVSALAPLEVHTQAAARPTSPEWTALAEAEKITQATPPKPPRPGAKKIGRALQTHLVAEFTPLRVAEAELLKARKLPPAKHDLARKFELVAGAAGKADADVISFRKAVIDPISRNADDLNTYLFLKRTMDRLAHDPEGRQVGNWTVEKAETALEGLRQKVGDNTLKQLDAAGQAFQAEMDKALRLQVDSGRMTEELYTQIKEANDFYAPFKVLKYMDPEKAPVSGTGRPIATTQDLTKAIQGITSEDFQIGNILQSAAGQIVRSRILAEKNAAMLALDEVAALDTQGTLFRKVAAGEHVGRDRQAVRYFKDGVEQTLETTPEIAQAVQGLNRAQSGLMAKALGQAAQPLRWGATSANMAFQVVNLLFADAPRTTLISRYGIRNPLDLVRYPLDFVYGFYSSLRGNYGKPNELYMDWLRSGAARSTIQRELTPGAFRQTLRLPEKPSLKAQMRRALGTLDPSNIARFGNAIEEANKITGLRRALRLDKVAAMPEAQRRAALDEIATEIRNYSGSPDFARRGVTGRDLNLLLMFFNARVQGVAADFARLAGKTGGKEAAAAWARLTTAVGLPALALALVNRSDEYREDYLKVPERERDSYFLIPRDTFFIDENGEQVRDYWRIPKREIVQMFANTIETAVDFATERDPQSLTRLAEDLLGNISPINISGSTLSERGESVIASMNPLLKVPTEYAMGRDTYWHRDLVPYGLRNASPELQYRETTPDLYRQIGSLTQQPPVKIQHAIRGATAGLFTQFTPPKGQEGRSWMATNPLFRRFVRSHIVNDADQRREFEAAMTRQTDARVLRQREARDLLKGIADKPFAEQMRLIGEATRNRPDLAEEVQRQREQAANPLTYWERRIKMLGVESGERAAFISAMLDRQPDAAARSKLLADLARKGLLSDKVMGQVSAEQARSDAASRMAP